MLLNPYGLIITACLYINKENTLHIAIETAYADPKKTQSKRVKSVRKKITAQIDLFQD